MIEKKVDYVQGNAFQKSRAFSPAVVVSGGQTVWLAGQTATVDAQGHDICGDFEKQVDAIFALIDQTLRTLGGSLSDLVSMTVFINDTRYGDLFVQKRKEIFKSGHFPASALITVSQFARPGMMLEIQSVAVI